MKILLVGSTGTIGSAIVKHLNDEGYQVTGVSRNTSPALDIEDTASIDKFFTVAGPLDAVICAAGSARGGSVLDLSDEQVQIGIKSKLSGQINLARRALKKLGPDGTILLTGGIFAYNPLPGTFGYAIANMGLNGFVRAASVDLQNGPRMNVIHPPLVRETALEFKMDETGCPPVAEVAEAYFKALQQDVTGQALFMEGYEPVKSE